MDRRSFYHLTSLLTPFQRKKGIRIIIFTSLGSLLDFFSLAVFLPLLYLLINPEFIKTNAFAGSIYQWGRFSSYTTFVLTFVSGIIIVLILKNRIAWWISRRKANYAFTVGSELSLRALMRYSEMNYIRFPGIDFTKELNRVTNYPFAFANNIILPGINFFSEAIVCTLIVTGLTLYDYQVAVILLLIFIPVMFLFLKRKTYLKKISEDMKTKYPALLKITLRVIEGFTEIRASGKQPFFHSKFEAVNKELAETMTKDNVAQVGTTRLTEVIAGTTICALIVYALLTGQGHEQTLMLLGIFATASFRIIPSANRILNALQQMRVHGHVLEELRDVIGKDNHKTERPLLKMCFEESVELKNISFTYPDGPPILKSVSLKIRKGEKIIIQGKSGEGKTTLFLILLRFIEENAGTITVDNKPIANENSWRSIIGYVPQNPYILDGTILENIAFGIPAEEIDRKKIEQLILELALTDLINQLPHGIDTEIGERGVKLSGGQRQRLAIARALYADAEILLLDEITNQVHPSLEQEIWKILHTLSTQNKTIVLITHKLPDTGFFQSIYTLENGIVKEAVQTKIYSS
jgi:ABC-type multidrug transport system fused ATPase/permease subunit